MYLCLIRFALCSAPPVSLAPCVMSQRCICQESEVLARIALRSLGRFVTSMHKAFPHGSPTIVRRQPISGEETGAGSRAGAGAGVGAGAGAGAQSSEEGKEVRLTIDAVVVCEVAGWDCSARQIGMAAVDLCSVMFRLRVSNRSPVRWDSIGHEKDGDDNDDHDDDDGDDDTIRNLCMIRKFTLSGTALRLVFVPSWPIIFRWNC